MDTLGLCRSCLSHSHVSRGGDLVLTGPGVPPPAPGVCILSVRLAASSGCPFPLYPLQPAYPTDTPVLGHLRVRSRSLTSRVPRASSYPTVCTEEEFDHDLVVNTVGLERLETMWPNVEVRRLSPDTRLARGRFRAAGTLWLFPPGGEAGRSTAAGTSGRRFCCSCHPLGVDRWDGPPPCPSAAWVGSRSMDNADKLDGGDGVPGEGGFHGEG